MSHDLDSLYEVSDEQLGTATLSFCKEPQERSQTSDHIKKWRNAPMEALPVTTSPNPHIDNSWDAFREKLYKYVQRDRKMQIVSNQIITPENEKKYVAYTIRVHKVGSDVDQNPTFIQRRYTDFLELYNNLRREQPVLNDAPFPKKVLVGNFEPAVIIGRRRSLESFLSLISDDHKLHQTSYFADFLQGAEQREAEVWISNKRYDQAIPLLENSFRSLNKFFTDRHPLVIVALCRLVACCAADTNGEAKQGGCAERFAELALRRFEGVSDSDLLRFYVPLLQVCVHLWWVLGKDKQALSDELESLKRRGIKVDGCDTLFDAVFKL